MRHAHDPTALVALAASATTTHESAQLGGMHRSGTVNRREGSRGARRASSTA
ncbi:MAG: hypothetical protein AAB388_04400 [Patescibacteria group bacterium]